MSALGSLTWPEVHAGLLLVIPLGSTEQHGPHLPLATDTLIAGAIAEGAGRRRAADLVVAPPVAYGSSGEHAGFPGTLSIGQEALEAVVVELVRSADAFAGVVLVNGHGGNAEPLARAARVLGREHRDVLMWAPSLAGDLHAGRVETSLMLAIAPELVRLSEAVTGDTRPAREVVPELRQRGVAAVSPTGVLGDPAGASAAEGHELLGRLVDDLSAAIGRRWPA